MQNQQNTLNRQYLERALEKAKGIRNGNLFAPDKFNQLIGYLEGGIKYFKWEEKFNKFFVSIGGGTTLNSREEVIAQKDSIRDFISTLLQAQRKERFEEGYRKGVQDEVKCIETSGEHGEAVKKIRKEVIESVKKVICKECQNKI